MKKEIQQVIANAGSEEITEIMDVTLTRYKQLFSDWDISMINIERGRDRNIQLDRMIAVLEKMKDI